MTFAPKQDWKAYRAAVDLHVNRVVASDQVSMDQRFIRYADYFNAIHQMRMELAVSPNAELARLEEKIEQRKRLVEIDQAWDQFQRGQSTPIRTR